MATWVAWCASMRTLQIFCEHCRGVIYGDLDCLVRMNAHPTDIL